MLLYSFLSAPNRKRDETERFRNVRFAHRGLWSADVLENSLKAFALAADAGFGIELDVHLTADNALVVIHDNDTARICGVKLSVEKSTFAELSELRLNGSDEKIPLFSEVLALVDGRVPLLVEIKADSGDIAVCEHVARLLDTYKGAYCIESFNPFAVKWFRKNRPAVVRGQLSSKIKTTGKDDFKGRFSGFLLSNLVINFLGRPDFIAYDIAHINRFAPRFVLKIFKAPVAVWTLRGEAAQKAAEGKFFSYIFEKDG